MPNRIAHQTTFGHVFSALDHHADELGCSLTVTHDGLRQFDGNGHDGGFHFGPAGIGFAREVRAGLPGSQHHERVVGGHIAIDRNAVEGLVSCFLDQFLQQRAGNAGIGRQKTEHGRHVRLDHPGALGNPRNRDHLALYRHLP